jgi:uncharacterized protein
METTLRNRVTTPWFLADWRDVTFLHFSIAPDLLRPHVPFDLDLLAGRAWVSLVAFTQANLRPAIGGRIGQLLTSPVATHGFLNLRTYVRGPDGEHAICFLAEWIPNRLSLVTGPMTYGLPFRLGNPDYRKDGGIVEALGRSLSFRITGASDENEPPEFLLERYSAFTCHRGRRRRFDIDHEPWTHDAVNVVIDDASLITSAAPWFRDARFESAHRSPGVTDVAIGRPVLVRRRNCRRS